MKNKFLCILLIVSFILPVPFIFAGCKNETDMYKVKFYNYDKTFVCEKSVKKNTAAETPNVEKASDQYNVYVFDKWEYEDGSDATSDLLNVTKNINVYAKFTETHPVYEINYLDDDRTTILHTTRVVRGYESPADPSGSGKQNEYFDLSFNGWEKENGEAWVGEDVVLNNINVYASYDIISQHTPFTISFYDIDKATLLHTQSMMKGDALSGDICQSKSFYSYSGVDYSFGISYWADENGERVDILNCVKNQSLYAVSNKINGSLNGETCYIFEQIENEAGYTLVYVNGDLINNFKIPSYFNSVPVTHISGNVNFDGVRFVVIPDTVKTIEPNTFNLGKNTYNTTLVSVEIGSGVTSIGESAFENCVALSIVNFGENVNTIGNYAFSHCNSLSFIELPEKLTRIGENAFSSCEILQGTISIPVSVEYVGSSAFKHSSKINKIILNAKSSLIYVDSFDNNSVLVISDKVEALSVDGAYTGSIYKAVFIDSTNIAADIPYRLLTWNNRIYIKSDLSNVDESMGEFVKKESSDVNGYDLYVSN